MNFLQKKITFFFLLCCSSTFSQSECGNHELNCNYKLIYTKLYNTVAVDTNNLKKDSLDLWIRDLDCISNENDISKKIRKINYLDYQLDIYLFDELDDEHLNMELNSDQKVFLVRFLQGYFENKRAELKEEMK